MVANGFQAWMAGEPLPAPTREQRLQACYDGLTGGQPVSPNQSALAAILAFRMVDGDVQKLNTQEA